MKWSSAVFLGLFIFVGVVIVVWLKDAANAKQTNSANLARSRRRPAIRWRYCLWLLLYLVVAGIFWSFVPRKPQQQPDPPENSTNALLCPVFFVGLVLLISIRIVRVRLRKYDRDVNRAFRRANEGDVEGALVDLRRAIEEKGMTVNRANGLGLLLAKQEKWDEALAAFKEAERCGGANQGTNRWHIGLALTRLGRGEEARPYLLNAAELEPHRTSLGCQICRLLVESGYRDDARDVFQNVDKALDAPTYLSSSHWKKLEAEVEECRALVEGKPPSGAADLLNER